MNHFRMNLVDWAALTLVVIGALNWGLIGMAHFIDASANWNLVNLLFDGIPTVEFGIYLLVGLAALWTAYLATRLAGPRVEDLTIDADLPGQTPK